MDEELKLTDFDILGIINLNDIHGIEKYVTPIIQDGRPTGYLSRSREYYNVKTMTELSLEREELKSKLTSEASKRNFVILEHMLNCSARVYYKKMERYILSGRTEGEEAYRVAEQCLEEDMGNILRLLQKESIIFGNTMLPAGTENSAKRTIEMDNKAFLLIFGKALKLNAESQNVEVLTPGYGSIYIGPMLKCMYGYNYTNVLRSKYIKDANPTQDGTLLSGLSNGRILQPDRTILLLDDNVGTGNTMKEIVDELKELGIENTTAGAIQFNWRNYLKVSTGDKQDINRFDVSNFDILSPLNYAGHKLYEHAIDWLHSSGEEYVNYLRGKDYRRDDMSDLEGALYRGILCARLTGLELQDGYNVPLDVELPEIKILDEYANGPTDISNPIARKIVSRLIKLVNDASRVDQTSIEDELQH